MKQTVNTYRKAGDYDETNAMVLIKTEVIDLPDPEISPLEKLEARVKGLERVRLPD